MGILFQNHYSVGSLFFQFEQENKSGGLGLNGFSIYLGIFTYSEEKKNVDQVKNSLI